MIEIRNVTTITGKTIDHFISSPEHLTIDGRGLLLFPGLIDAHVHFRTPGLEHKENWITASRAAIRGGITTVFDMPNTLPATVTAANLENKKALIEKQLKAAGIPLRFHLFLGASKEAFHELAAAKEKSIGLKVFMGSSTGDLLMDDESSLHAAFSLASAHNLLVAVHAEEEKLIRERKKQFPPPLSTSHHSIIRSPEVAFLATKKAIDLAKLYKTRLLILHVSTKKELSLIAAAKREGVCVYAEATPHHLLLTEADYALWGNKVQTNPPLRTQEDAAALWDALLSGIIDTIGSDHAPHTLEEKARPYGLSPSGIPGVETTLPLLLNAFHEGRLPLQKIIALMKENVENIFELQPNDDAVLIDLERVQEVTDAALQCKCGWSPYSGKKLKGWPLYTILQGKVFRHDTPI